MKYYILQRNQMSPTGDYRVEVNGYDIDGLAGVHKDGQLWTLTDLQTGMALNFPFDRKKDAVEFYKSLDIDRIRQKPAYMKAIERFNEAPIKE